MVDLTKKSGKILGEIVLIEMDFKWTKEQWTWINLE